MKIGAYSSRKESALYGNSLQWEVGTVTVFFLGMTVCMHKNLFTREGGGGGGGGEGG